MSTILCGLKEKRRQKYQLLLNHLLKFGTLFPVTLIGLLLLKHSKTLTTEKNQLGTERDLFNLLYEKPL